MKRNHWLTRLAGLLLASFTLLTATVMATGGAGTKDDPLVTLSYLNEIFLPEMLESVDDKLETRNEELTESILDEVAKEVKPSEGNPGAEARVDAFKVVTMSSGQILSGEIGCEVMLRVGTAACVSPSSPGLIDETDASTLDNGAALVKNHLYMMTISDRGVKATAATTKLLVRGSYTIR